MRNSPNEHNRGPYNGQRRRHRVNRNRNRVRVRNKGSEHASSQGKHAEGPPLHRRQILRQMHASDRKDRRENTPSSQRRKRPPMNKADFRSRNRQRGAFSSARRRKKASEGESPHRRGKNVGRRFRWVPAAIEHQPIFVFYL